MFINTHRQDELTAEFKRLARPRRGAIITSARVVLTLLKPLLKGIDVNSVDRLLGKYHREQSLRRAAYIWIDPHCTWNRDSMGDFQESVGLKKLRRDEFCTRVEYYCQLLRDESPLLSRHIEARIAELEFVYLADSTQVRYYSELEIYQRDVLSNAIRMAKEATDAVDHANSTLTKILPAIAAVFRKVLDPLSEEEVNVNANFMAVVDLQRKVNVPEVPGLIGKYGKNDATVRATDLWEDLDPEVDRVFVITNDSDVNHRIGFWIPDIIEDNKMMIPGAPAAFHQKIPDAVFIDDAPELPVGPIATKRKWEQYLTDKGDGGFRDDMFISIPILARARHDADPSVVGIVNVNCRGYHWPRAYSRSWLKLAAKLASPFLYLVWHSFVIHYYAASKRDSGLFGKDPFVRGLPNPEPKDGDDE